MTPSRSRWSASVVGPPLHYALVARGFAPDEVVETSLAMLLPWLESRGRRIPGRSAAQRPVLEPTIEPPSHPRYVLDLVIRDLLRRVVRG